MTYEPDIVPGSGGGAVSESDHYEAEKLAMHYLRERDEARAQPAAASQHALVIHDAVCPALCQQTGMSFGTMMLFRGHKGPNRDFGGCHTCTCGAEGKLNELVAAADFLLNVNEVTSSSGMRLESALQPFREVK